MASAAEQLAANLNFGVLAKATELKKRIWFTIAALVVYRLGTWIPVPGISPQALADVFKGGGGVLGMVDMLAGGSLQRMTIFALAIMPYISASIIMQLMATIIPSLEAIKKEGEQGRKKINQYTRYLTVIIAIAQAFGIASSLISESMITMESIVLFKISAVVTLTAGTMFLMWLGEQITARGVGQGTSLIIFTGIVAELPRHLVATLELGATSSALPSYAIPLVMVLAVALVALIVFVERAQRRILVQYPKRQQGNKVYGGESSHLPLKINTPGVIPPIFASSLLLMPTTILHFSAAGNKGPEWFQDVAALMGRGHWLYLTLYAALIVFFCFFYTAVVFNPVDTADNLKKNGGFVPGYRPGKNTSDYLDYVLTRLTVVGSLYLVGLSILPELVIAQWGLPLYLGGTSLLIVVTVTLDTVSQIQSHLLAHQYEGLIKKSRLRGRRG